MSNSMMKQDSNLVDIESYRFMEAVSALRSLNRCDSYSLQESLSDGTTTVEGSDSEDSDDEILDTDMDMNKPAPAASDEKKQATKSTEDLPKSFPGKLMEILDEDDSSDVIAWLPDGKSFCILSPKKFTLEVLPQFFKLSEFSSFRRKLYWWGFKKTSKSGNDTFHHELFQRGNYLLCRRMHGCKFQGLRWKKSRSKKQSPRNNQSQPNASHVEKKDSQVNCKPRHQSNAQHLISPSLSKYANNSMDQASNTNNPQRNEQLKRCSYYTTSNQARSSLITQYMLQQNARSANYFLPQMFQQNISQLSANAMNIMKHQGLSIYPQVQPMSMNMNGPNVQNQPSLYDILPTLSSFRL